MYVVSVPLREKTGALCCLTPHEKLDTSLGISHSIFDDQLNYRTVCVSWMSRKFIHYNKTLNWDCLLCMYRVVIFKNSSSCSAFYKGWRKKVKCTLVQALRLCTGRTALRGSRSIALPFHDHGTRKGWVVSVTSGPLFTPGKDPVPIVQEAGWAPRPVWTGAENLTSTGIRSQDRPARSQSLCRLRYPTHYKGWDTG